MIQACDSAIAAQGKQIKDLKLGLTNSQNDVRLLNTQVQERDASLGSIWHNPWVWLGVGFLAGAIVMRR